MLRNVIFILSCALTTIPAVAGEISYVFTTLTGPPGQPAAAFDINARGEIAGELNFRPAVYAGGAWAPLDLTPFNNFGAFFGAASAINDAGEVLVTGFSGGPPAGIVIHTRSGNTPLFCGPCEATGLNGQGEIVGFWRALSPPNAGTFLFSGGQFTFVNNAVQAVPIAYTGINNAGRIVGYIANPHIGFVDTPQGRTIVSVPGASDTSPQGINNSGDVVGYFSDSTGTHGFVFSKNGGFITLDVPGASNTFAYGINDRGEVAGYFELNQVQYAFLAEPIR